MVVLDTDAISFLEHRESAGSKELQRYLTALSAEHEVVTTVITYEEQTRGWFSKMARARTMPEQIIAYARLKQHLRNYRDIEVLDFDGPAAEQFQNLKALKIRIGTADLKIAATALSREAVLLTRNLHDFKQVPHLRIKDWTKI